MRPGELHESGAEVKPRHGSIWKSRRTGALVRVDEVERRGREQLLDGSRGVYRVTEFVTYRYLTNGQPSKLPLDSFSHDFEPVATLDPLAWRERLAEVEL